MKPSELLADPKAWTKGEFARLADGSRCQVFDDNAASFCIIGALSRCQLGGGVSLDTLATITHGDPAKWNDAPERQHAEVLEALKACGL